MKKQAITVRGIGHSNRSLPTFLKKLSDNNIEVLIDVRYHPFSRRFPHFSSASLEKSLEKVNILYLDMGEALGGIGERPTPERFARSILNIVRLAKVKKVVVMCSEGSHLECHRHTVLEPALESCGVTLEHIEYQKHEK